MKINLNKKLSQSKKKEYTYRDKSYDWDLNYEKLIKENIEANFSYDIDKRHNLIDGEEISDIMLDDIVKMFNKSGLGINNQNSINKAITKICKEKSFSKKEEERKNKEKTLQEIPDKLYKYILVEYGNDLSYNIYKEQIYYKDKLITTHDIDTITMQVQKVTMFKHIIKRDIKAIIHEVAKEHSFKEEITMDEEINENWNILSDVDPDNWQEYLIKDKGMYRHNTFNYALFLTFHPQFKDKISFNLFDKIESLRMYDKDYGKVVNKPIDDDLVHLIEAQIERYFGDFNTKYVERALSVVLNNNSFHEIKQRFKQFEKIGWDGTPRMHEIFIKYFGCEDCNEIREMTEVMLCGSVQRILEESPDCGTMFDYMGIQFGIQGTGKTKFMTRLYLGDKYTSINPDVNDDQKFTDLANRAWLILFDELKGINNADMPTVKSRITEQGANVRLSYGRRSKYHPRHVVFWGNTNYPAVLRDVGYERRFLCFEFNNEEKHSPEWWETNYTDYDIQQIWAETLKIYHEKWENKVIHISKETEDWNYNIQIRHKVWKEDPRTDLELKEILNFDGYSYPIYKPNQWRVWMKELDELKLKGTYTKKNKIDIINCNWVLSRILRKQDWITGMMSENGWKKIHVNDNFFGNEDYYIKQDITLEDIKMKYERYSGEDYEAKPDNLPF